MRSNRCLSLWACWLGLAACGGSGAQGALPSPRLFDPLSYQSLPGSARAFGAREGSLRSYFHRQGPVVVNMLAQSGPDPSWITRFSGSDRGIAVWFLPAAENTELYAGAGPDAERLASGGGLVAIRRDQGRHSLYGVRGTLKSNATRLSTELVLLGSSGMLRDHAGGACPENAARSPELSSEHFELDAERDALRISREESNGAPWLELLLIGAHGTHIALRERQGAPSPSCALAVGAGQPIIDLSNDAGVQLQFIALASDGPSAAGDAAPDDPAAPGGPPAKVR